MRRPTHLQGQLVSLLLLILLGLPVLCWAGNFEVLIVLSNSSTPYRTFATALAGALPPSMTARVVESPEAVGSEETGSNLVVTVGVKAAERMALQATLPVLAVMIPQTESENLAVRFRSKNPAQFFSAIYIDQPWLRQIDFWRAALPGRRRVGLLHTSNAVIDFALLRREIDKHNGVLVARQVGSPGELFTALDNVLSGSDVLVAVPDSSIYSSGNIRNILLSSYRRGIPLVGLSQSYVNAGALCAIFSSPEQLANQTGSTIVSFAKTGKLPKAQYPEEFSIAVNWQVARSMGVEVPSREKILSLMGATGEKGN